MENILLNIMHISGRRLTHFSWDIAALIVSLKSLGIGH